MGARVASSEDVRGADVTAQKTGAQHLQDVLNKRTHQPFEGSGCNYHVTHRHLLLSVAGALIGVVVLLAVLLM